MSDVFIISSLNESSLRNMLIERSSAFDLSSPSEAVSQLDQYHLIAKRPNLNTLVHVCVPFSLPTTETASHKKKKKKTTENPKNRQVSGRAGTEEHFRQVRGKRFGVLAPSRSFL